MIFETYRLSRDRKKIEVKELNLDSFEKIGLTGRGLALKPKGEEHSFYKPKIALI